MEILTEDWIYQKSSQELTSLLYEALLDNIENAIKDIEMDDFLSSNKKLQKANDILERLGVGLNYEAGIIANQLDTLYNYMANKLVEGNIKKDLNIIKEVQDIVIKIADGWNQAMKNKSNPSVNNMSKTTNAYEKNIMVSQNQPLKSYVGEK